ncbi:MAG: hypothetical protein AAB922_02170 [Patescibacteria group bacterium]
MNDMPRLTKKESIELIVYQIGEVKNLVGNLITKFESMDKRVTDLEKFQVVQDSLNKSEPKVDVQKIILAAFGLISAVVAATLGLNQSRIFK